MEALEAATEVAGAEEEAALELPAGALLAGALEAAPDPEAGGCPTQEVEEPAWMVMGAEKAGTPAWSEMRRVIEVPAARFTVQT